MYDNTHDARRSGTFNLPCATLYIALICYAKKGESVNVICYTENRKGEKIKYYMIILRYPPASVLPTARAPLSLSWCG